jgi:hypothetical protein
VRERSFDKQNISPSLHSYILVARVTPFAIVSTVPTMTMDEVANGGISADATRRPLTPTLPTPAGSKTPPTVSRREFGESSTNLHSRRTSEAMEADSLSRRLKEFEAAGSVRTRDRTPGRSPSRKRQRVYGDRYVGTCPQISQALQR